MKIFKGKTFFIRSILLHVFLVIVIAFVSINFWENPVYDAIINSSSATVEGSKDISLIVIDNKSLDSYRWPWARSLYGEIFEYLNKYTNAKVVIFDSVLSSLDKERPASSDNFFFETVKKSDNFIGGYMAQSKKYDSQTLGNAYDKAFYKKFSIDITDKRTKNNSRLSSYNSLTMFPKAYFDAQKQAGSVNL